MTPLPPSSSCSSFSLVPIRFPSSTPFVVWPNCFLSISSFSPNSRACIRKTIQNGCAREGQPAEHPHLKHSAAALHSHHAAEGEEANIAEPQQQQQQQQQQQLLRARSNQTGSQQEVPQEPTNARLLPPGDVCDTANASDIGEVQPSRSTLSCPKPVRLAPVFGMGYRRPNTPPPRLSPLRNALPPSPPPSSPPPLPPTHAAVLQAPRPIPAHEQEQSLQEQEKHLQEPKQPQEQPRGQEQRPSAYTHPSSPPREQRRIATIPPFLSSPRASRWLLNNSDRRAGRYSGVREGDQEGGDHDGTSEASGGITAYDIPGGSGGPSAKGLGSVSTGNASVGAGAEGHSRSIRHAGAEGRDEPTIVRDEKSWPVDIDDGGGSCSSGGVLTVEEYESDFEEDGEH